jgi:hypothetical protein
VTRVVRTAAGATAALAALLVLAGHAITPSIAASVVVIVQAVGGVLAWSMVVRRGTRSSEGATDFAIGSVLGIAASAFASLATVGTPLAAFSWALPTVVVAGAAVIRGPRAAIAPLSSSSVAWISLAALVAFEATFRAVQRGIMRPARETLFTSVSRAERYKAKAFIDTFVYRAGDVVGAQTEGLLGRLGMGLAALAACAVPRAMVSLKVSTTLLPTATATASSAGLKLTTTGAVVSAVLVACAVSV